MPTRLTTDDYVFATLDLTDEAEDARARRSAWLGAVQRGFHQGRPDEEYERLWLAHCAADGVVCRGAWLPDGEFGAGPAPVATYSSFDKTLNTGRGLLPLRMVTDVTTSPAHRRRGLIRRLIEDDLADAVAHDVPLAALTASEATIYGRWGFGAATSDHKVEVDTGPRFALRPYVDAGRVELVEPADSWPLLDPLLRRHHETTFGSVAWPQFYEPFLTGAYDWENGGPDKKLRGAVHLDESGEVDGVVLYKHTGRDGEKRKLGVELFVALSADAALALWDFVGHVDLVNHVTWGNVAPDDPLRWALVDMRAATYSGPGEFLWIRVLDVVRALEGRPWSGEGRVVLEVVDPQGHTSGRYAVETTAGAARVTGTDEAAEVRLDSETLGSLYLAGVGVDTLRRAGRVTGTGEAVARFAAIADLPRTPYNLTGF